MTETPSEQNYAPIPESVTKALPSIGDVQLSVEPDIEVTERPSPAAIPQQTAAPVETFKVSGAGLQTAVIALVFLVIGFIGGAVVFNRGGGGATTAEIEAIVRAVVAEEVASISIGGGINMKELVDNTDPSFGPDDAPITIVEFSDFFCAYCTRFANETLPLLQQQYPNQIRFVYRDLPIIGGQISFQAAIAANCAHDQNQFWEFHNMLFANNQARTREAWISFADELGLDTESFTACLDDTSKQDEITLDFVDGQGLGIQGTPAFYINGKHVSGAQPFATFAIIIDEELRKLGIEPPARITPNA